MSKKSLLIVDDEESIRVSLQRMLKKENYEVDTAPNGSIALKKLENNHFDLILTDIMMEDMSGLRLLQNIKGKYSGINVLLMTGHASIDSAVEALRLGACDYIVKPCSKKEILSGIKNVLNSITPYKKKILSQCSNENLKVLSGKKPLTKRELMVCECLLGGMTGNHIATKLNVTLPTIKFHLKNIYTKLGIKGRREILKVLQTD
jgi:DNA-binding NarL/FixJ family response regulator